MSRAIFIHSQQISFFEQDIQSALMKGWDLYQGLVLGNDGEIGQWLVEGKSLYEYRLVLAASAEMLNTLVDGHIAEGWDFQHGTVTFGELYIQWMCRETYYEVDEEISVKSIISAEV